MSKNNNKETSTDREVFTYKEHIADGLRFEMQLKRVLASTKSEYQDIDVIETFFGKTLVTDGLTQSTQFDEFAYHESLVHPALVKFALRGVSGNNGSTTTTPVETVLIGGGGELATAREVLRHKSVRRVVMVDLDSKVVEVSREHLPEWGGEAVMTDARFELVIGDAHEYISKTQEKFDIIIMDISDPVEAGPGIALYTKEFYEIMVTKLTPHGVFVSQSGMADSIPRTFAEQGQEPMSFGPIRNTLATVFGVSMPYAANIPSFGGDWGFVMAFHSDKPEEDAERWRSPSVHAIDSLLEEQITGGQSALKHYDGMTHCRMFSLTKTLRQYLEKEKRIMTKDDPIYMFG